MNPRFPMRLCLAWFCLLALGHAEEAAHNRVSPRRAYVAQRVTHAPVIEGRLNDAVWQNPEGWDGDFVQYAPQEGSAATRKTRFKIVFDDNNLYAAIQCYDELGLVRRIFAQRDDQDGDLVGLAIDSYHNRQTAFEFDLTAAGQKVDIMYLPGANNYDDNWNPVWEGASALNDSGWAAEFRIPFSQLRYHDRPEHTWGLHVWRTVNRLKEESHWNLMPSTATPGAQNFGTLEGVSSIRTSRQTEIMPYVSLKSDHDFGKAGSHWEETKWAPRAGLDAKIGISSNFTLDATVNPDFGQVEADPAVLNLTAYETYLEEKRPFFLEGTDIFDYKAFSVDGTANKLFYSRRIGADNTSILASGKLTGRTRNGFSLGILETVTGPEYATIPDEGGGHRALTEPYTSYFASRVRRESEDGNTHIGASVNSVSRVLDGYGLDQERVSWASTAGLDFKQEVLDKLWYYQANVFGSYLTGSREAISKRQEDDLHGFQRLGASHLRVDSAATVLSGEGATAEIGKQGGLFQFWVNGSVWSPGLDFYDIGYMKETDRIFQEVGGFLLNNKPRYFSNFIRAGGSINNGWSLGGEHVNTKGVVYVQAKLKNLWEAYAETGYNFPSLDTRILRGGPAMYQDGYTWSYLQLTTDQAKRVYGQLRGSYEFNAETGRMARGLGLKLSFNPIDRLTFSANMQLDQNDYPFEFFGEVLPSGEYVVGRQERQTASLTLRAGYYITPKISFQYHGNPYLSVVDYSDFHKVADASAKKRSARFQGFAGAGLDNPDEAYGQLRSNLVFRLEYAAGSFLYLVWSHARYRDEFLDAPSLEGSAEALFDHSSRNIIMAKLSYWLNL